MTDSGYVDLHTHTTASDGVHSPSDNVRMAKEAGLVGLAITDHDTIAGVAEALSEGKRLGVTVVPGVEISSAIDGLDIHVLGYYIDCNCEVLLERLRQLRQIREQRNALILERLKELGIPILKDDISRLAAKSKDVSVGRPHIAEAMVHRGFVGSISEAFERYLGNRGAAYVKPPRISPMEAARYIHEAKGKAVLAHPGLYRNNVVVEELLKSGQFDGLEVYHSDHKPEEEMHYKQLADKYHLIMTAGSDFHGIRSKEAYHGAIGNRSIEHNVLSLLQSI